MKTIVPLPFDRVPGFKRKKGKTWLLKENNLGKEGNLRRNAYGHFSLGRGL